MRTTASVAMNRNSMLGSSVPLGNNTGVVIGNVQQQSSHLLMGHHTKMQIPSPPTSNGGGGGALDNLPKRFVSSMRTLFDIMDDKRTGFVRLADIEHRWQDDGSKGLPPGVIDSLRRVTPASGMLSFDRFCAGLKICLLKSQSEGKGSSRRSSTSASSDSNNSHVNVNINTSTTSSKSSRPPSAPLLDLDDAPMNHHNINNNISNNNLNTFNGLNNNNINNNNQWKANNTAAVRPNNAMPVVQRTLSLPKLSPSSDGDSSSDRYASPTSIYAAPPKPPRTALLMNNGTTNINHLDRFDKAEIRHALQNWQMNVLMNEMEAKDKRRAVAIPNTATLIRGSADGSSPNGIYSNSQPIVAPPLPPLPPLPPMTHAQQQDTFKQQQKAIAVALQQQQQQKKQNNRRREPRRHTLQNGIDYNMLKRLKHYEDEKEVLVHGLAAVENAQEWYFKQLAIVEDKIKYLGRIEAHAVSVWFL